MESPENDKQTVNSDAPVREPLVSLNEVPRASFDIDGAEPTPPPPQSETEVDQVIVTPKKQHPLRDAALRVVTAPLANVVGGVADMLEVPGGAIATAKALAKGDMDGAALQAAEMIKDASGLKRAGITLANPLASMGLQAGIEGYKLAKNEKEKADFKKANPELYAKPLEPTTPVALSVAVIAPADKPGKIEFDPSFQEKLAALDLTKMEYAKADAAQSVTPSSSKGADIKAAQNDLAGR